MAGSSQTVRRVVGGIFMGGAILMVIAGSTVWADRLQGSSFLIYWLICALLTILTLIIAMLDLLLIRRRSREQHKELIRDILDSIAENQTKSSENSDSRK